MKQTGTTHRIRALLRDADGPLSIDEIVDALPDTVARGNITALLCQRKAAGEFSVSIIDRKPHYALVAGFAKPCPQRTPLGAQSVSPPAPSSAHSEAPTGPASVASPSPAPPRTPDAATPRADHAAALETSLKRSCQKIAAECARPQGPSVAEQVWQLAEDLEAAARAMASDGTDGESLRMVISGCALANRLAGLLAAGARA